eukprot:CAMPEP_0183409096 /NCGR_PEP_ID=MMETSP0370-20130417/18573_1 /TAXON_ID=268820 /ORGANISM="Peridinium aciculiferum, Strain PAER-2" /LENGTH=41 /DNA_ID= /DNA_START= /DNA_END= /DNA_ORIENTATION=
MAKQHAVPVLAMLFALGAAMPVTFTADSLAALAGSSTLARA